MGAGGKRLKWLMAVAGLVALGALATIHLGLPDVAATKPHWKITEWALSTTMENAVRRRAAALAVPADLEDPARIRSGASAYDGMCAGCHAAPAVEASPPAARRSCKKSNPYWVAVP